MLVLALLLAWDPVAAPGPVFCLLRRTTGLPCPSCGLTRAFALLLRGDFAGAWARHPLAPLLALEALALWLAALVAVLRRRPLLATSLAPVPRVALATATLMVAVWLGRLATGVAAG